jgi:hypothetical protein
MAMRDRQIDFAVKRARRTKGLPVVSLKRECRRWMRLAKLAGIDPREPNLMPIYWERVEVMEPSAEAEGRSRP